MALFQYSDQQFPKRIVLIGRGRSEEFYADGAITPGQLLKINSAGNTIVHATAGGAAEAMFAVEDALQARTLDDAYAVGDRVSTHIADRGDVIYGWLADNEHVVAGDFLASAGNGDVRKKQSSDIAIGVALEAVDLTASANTAHGRLRLRVL